MKKSRTGRYIDRAIRSRAFVDILSMSIFPNAKEITESFAVYEAVRRYSPWRLDDPGVTVICVGDGRTPRTGAVFASFSGWTVHSVDPALRCEDSYPRIKRLTLWKRPISHFVPPTGGRVVIVACHSHAPWRETLRLFTGDILAVAMPCCVPHDLDIPPFLEYDDPDCWSPCRTIKVWMPDQLGSVHLA